MLKIKLELTTLSRSNLLLRFVRHAEPRGLPHGAASVPAGGTFRATRGNPGRHLRRVAVFRGQSVLANYRGNFWRLCVRDQNYPAFARSTVVCGYGWAFVAKLFNAAVDSLGRLFNSLEKSVRQQHVQPSAWCRCVVPQLDPFRAAVPFGGQTTWKLSGLSPKWDCSTICRIEGKIPSLPSHQQTSCYHASSAQL